MYAYLPIVRHRQIDEHTEAVFHELAPQRAALSAMDGTIAETQLAIARIAAPTGAEGLRAAFIANRLGAIGLATRIDEVGNVIARSGEGVGPPVLIAAHLDTVFPEATPLSIERHESRVVCPGICDNARGLAAMLAIAQAFSPPRSARPIEFVATVGEEGTGDLLGAKHYFAHAPAPFAMVALDGAGDERIVNVGLGSRRFRVAFSGPGGHSWNAFGTANAIHAAVHAASALADLRLASGSALTVSRIGGGLSVNSIPADAWFDVDMRGTREATLARLEAELREVVAAAVNSENQRAKRGIIAVAVQRIGTRPAGETGEDSAVVGAAQAATRLVGRTPTLAAASTDANAAMAVGVPSVAIGAGGKGGDTHSTSEWYDNTGASAGVQRALTVVAALAQLRP